MRVEWVKNFLWALKLPSFRFSLSSLDITSPPSIIYTLVTLTVCIIQLFIYNLMQCLSWSPFLWLKANTTGGIIHWWLCQRKLVDVVWYAVVEHATFVTVVQRMSWPLYIDVHPVEMVTGIVLRTCIVCGSQTPKATGVYIIESGEVMPREESEGGIASRIQKSLNHGNFEAQTKVVYSTLITTHNSYWYCAILLLYSLL